MKNFTAIGGRQKRERLFLVVAGWIREALGGSHNSLTLLSTFYRTALGTPVCSFTPVRNFYLLFLQHPHAACASLLQTAGLFWNRVVARWPRGNHRTSRRTIPGSVNPDHAGGDVEGLPKALIPYCAGARDRSLRAGKTRASQNVRIINRNAPPGAIIHSGVGENDCPAAHRRRLLGAPVFSRPPIPLLSPSGWLVGTERQGRRGGCLDRYNGRSASARLVDRSARKRPCDPLPPRQWR